MRLYILLAALALADLFFSSAVTFRIGAEANLLASLIYGGRDLVYVTIFKSAFTLIVLACIHALRRRSPPAARWIIAFALGSWATVLLADVGAAVLYSHR